MTENSKLLIDNVHGVWIPHRFANVMRGYTRSNIKDLFDDMLILEEGNPHLTEHYWEAWDNILQEFWFEDVNEQRFVLYLSENGDLWAVSIDELEQLEEENHDEG